MTQLSKVCVLGLRPCTHSNSSCLEEYRKTVEVDGQLTIVGVTLALVTKPSVLPEGHDIPFDPQMVTPLSFLTPLSLI